MGLFKSFKKALPAIGGTIGFAMGGPMGAALGSGIGSLASGGDVQDALTAAAVGGVSGYAAQGMGFGRGVGSGAQKFMPSYTGSSGVPRAAFGFGPEATTSQMNKIAMQQLPMPGEKSGIASMFGDMSFGQKAALGLGAASLLGGMEEAEQPKTFSRYDDSYEGEAFGEVVGPLTGNVYSIADESERKEYNKELQRYQKSGFNYAHGGDVNLGIQVVGGSSGDHIGGGEVDGPGTGTSDSVPARLSDGEFVLTAKAVRGAGGGDRDIGAARLYDMMSELEARG